MIIDFLLNHFGFKFFSNFKTFTPRTSIKPAPLYLLQNFLPVSTHLIWKSHEISKIIRNLNPSFPEDLQTIFVNSWDGPF